MKKIVLTILLFITVIIAYPQSSSSIVVMPNTTTAFGMSLSKGRVILCLSDSTFYMLTDKESSTKTIATSSVYVLPSRINGDFKVNGKFFVQKNLMSIIIDDNFLGIAKFWCIGKGDPHLAGDNWYIYNLDSIPAYHAPPFMFLGYEKSTGEVRVQASFIGLERSGLVFNNTYYNKEYKAELRNGAFSIIRNEHYSLRIDSTGLVYIGGWGPGDDGYALPRTKGTAGQSLKLDADGTHLIWFTP